MYDAKRDLTWDDINTLLTHISYDPDTGVFVWTKPTGRKAKVGNRVGASKSSNGSTTLCVAGVQYQAHRVAMLFITGAPLPKESVVCHINGDTRDNRACNLQLTSREAMKAETASKIKTNTHQITHDDLQKCLRYDPETGIIYHTRDSVNGKAKAGDRACRYWSDGYFVVKLERINIRAHRAAWMLYHGITLTTAQQIDHINGDRGDNKIENLRVVTPSVNSQNRHKPRSGNMSGFMGVTATRTTGIWTATVCLEGKNHYLGRFTTPEAAHQAYLEAKRRLHPGCTI